MHGLLYGKERIIGGDTAMANIRLFFRRVGPTCRPRQWGGVKVNWREGKYRIAFSDAPITQFNKRQRLTKVGQTIFYSHGFLSLSNIVGACCGQ